MSIRQVIDNFRRAIFKFALDAIILVGSSFVVIPSAIYSELNILLKKIFRFFSNLGKDLLSSINRLDDLIVKVFKRNKGVKKFKARMFKSVSSVKTLNLSKPKAREKVKWFILGSLFTIFFLLTPATAYSWYRQLPRPDLLNENMVKCTKLLDRKGRLIYEICPEKRGDPVPLNLVPKSMIDATLAIEDSSFYNHKGFRLLSILRAANETFFKDNVQGGSTITQQLVKLSLLSPERTVTRKIKELVLSVLTEQKYSKDQILEMYLNNAPYGGNVVGVESASQKFFGKRASELTLSESSLLSALPSAPSVYSPFSSLSVAKDRQKLVLSRMVKLKKITQEEADKAFSEEFVFTPQSDFIRAPHFVDYVRSELERMYGKRFVSFGGLTVLTTIDLDIQDKAQVIVKEEVEKSRQLNVSNGALIVLDPKTGEILSMVGSVDYFDVKNDGVFNVSVAKRQPGSAIKPVTYSLALTRGYKTTSVIDDSPLTVKTPYETYSPVNYDGKFHGKITLRRALANSYNVPAVKVLRTLNIDDMVNLGRDMGLVSWEADGNYGLSITLGGKEANLLDLTNVYGTLARGGVYKPTRPILNIKDSKGYEIFSNENLEKRVLSKEVSYIITDILSDYYARIPAFGTNNFLSIKGHKVAVKTGTTDQKRDNYTLGYTPSFVVGVWVGNNDNTPMNPTLSSGLTGAAPAWNRMMTELLTGKALEGFALPEGVIVKVYSDCSNIREVFVRGGEPDKISCGMEEKEKSDKKKKND
ncbi:hypothetical protein A2716_03465 [candidate division WWE3 bacterium RIFCSPHIGHO2_01_FULL_40_23]|uniref:Uncharacterized protein n=1 Tax=candidate division WWE3 bacterium RIFCSPLOWO2_01_FULL_41_18 TaxID=1802625 RepID=A0A1F4VD68_UNCKA|nr:MAG: hypothetical protein A2716_03465 [candidate division WWE3 bacterium RIFCSPHIGHO2_01_FULL_40_23]OGC54938.1 MAG: hypothetical protein A3A78_03075 [candidate division WWE3 bacterium RIFCSPLOWO2_01_FULL_41_18]